MKEKVNPNHHMGKWTGYELIDGVYHIAPQYQHQFDTLAHRKAGLDDMLHMVSVHVAKDLEQISKENKKIWDDICDDIGIDRDKTWRYFPDGTIKEGTK